MWNAQRSRPWNYNGLSVAGSCNRVNLLFDEQADSSTGEPPGTLLSGTASLIPCKRPISMSVEFKRLS